MIAKNTFSDNSAKRPLWRQKKVVIAAVLAVVLIIAGLAGYQLYAWRNYVDRNTRDYQSASDQARAFINSDEMKLETISSLQMSLKTEADRHCNGRPPLSDFRIQVDSSARSDSEVCQQNKQKLSDAEIAANDLLSRLNAEKSVAEVLKSASEQTAKVKQGDYAALQKIWKSVPEQLSALDVPELYKQELEAIMTATENINNKYDVLLKADKDKKRPQFDDAAVELRKAYDELAKVSEMSQKSYQTLAEKLIRSVESL